MMIQIYNKDNTNFDANGDMPLRPFYCTLKMELNGACEIELKQPIDQDGRWTSIVEDAIIAAPTPWSKKQLFRIYEKTTTTTGVIVYARHIFFDLIGTTLIDVRPTNKVGQDALANILQGTPFKAHSDITRATTAYYVRKNIVEAIFSDDENSFLNRWGGEFLPDNYDVYMNDHVGGDYGVYAKFGYNLTEIEETINLEDVVTRIIPVGYDGIMLSGQKPWVDSKNIKKYVNIRDKVIKFDDVKVKERAEDEEGFETLGEAQEELKKRCEQLYEGGIDQPKVNYKVDMENLSNKTIYQKYQELEKVNLGDVVRCTHRKIGIEVQARCISFEWDCLSGKYNSLELGNFKDDYFSGMADLNQKLNNILNNNGTVDAGVLQGSINALNTMFKAQRDIAQKQHVRAMLFEDLDPDSPTYGATSVGTMGLCVSNRRTADGRDWDWRTFIWGGGATADLLVAGALVGNMFDLNLNTGEVRLGDRDPETGVITDPVLHVKKNYFRIKIGGNDLDSVIKDINTTIEAMQGEISLKVEQGDITSAVNAAKSEIKITTDQISLNVSKVERSVSTAIETAAKDATTKADKALEDAKTYVTTTVKTAEAEIKITTDAITSRVALTEEKIVTLNGSVTNHETRIQNAEQKITPGAIISTVSDTVSNAIKTANGYTDTQKTVLQSQITQNAEAIEARVTKNGLGTAITQNANSVRIAWNNNTQYIQLEGGRLNVYDSAIQSTKKLAMSLGYNGMYLYRKDDGNAVGNIGTNQYVNDASIKGLVFDLETNGRYMTWASRDNPSDSTYTMKWTYCRSGFGNLPTGLSVGCDLDMRWFNIHNCNIVKNHGGVTSLGFVYYTNGDAQNFGYVEAMTTDHGVVGLNAWQSDGRLKKNIAQATENAVGYLKQIPVRAFDWKEGNSHETFGLIAQELEKLDPSLVYKVKQRDEKGAVLDETYQIIEHKFIPVLIKAVQELSAKTQEQDQMIRTLMNAQGIALDVKAAGAEVCSILPDQEIEQYPEDITIVKRIEKWEPEPLEFKVDDDGLMNFIDEGESND